MNKERTSHNTLSLANWFAGQAEARMTDSSALAVVGHDTYTVHEVSSRLRLALLKENEENGWRK